MNKEIIDHCTFSPQYFSKACISSSSSIFSSSVLLILYFFNNINGAVMGSDDYQMIIIFIYHLYGASCINIKHVMSNGY